MAKKEGYYSAAIAGCADPTVILYFDGEGMYSHGNETPLTDEFILFIDSEPFDHRDVNAGRECQSACDWFIDAAEGVTPKPIKEASHKSVYEVVLIVDGKSVTTYVEAQLKSDVYDRVSKSPKKIYIVSVRDVATSLGAIL
tara:strand:+ start:5252 stop:5674 length:423 start_codon:yes stop_codon:yes gene_type:complete